MHTRIVHRPISKQREHMKTRQIAKEYRMPVSHSYVYIYYIHTYTQSVYRHVLEAGKTIKLRNKQTPLLF